MLKVLTACWHLKSTANLNSFVLGCFVDSGEFNFRILLIFCHSYLTDNLRELAWSGVPQYLRPSVWRLLLVCHYAKN